MVGGIFRFTAYLLTVFIEPIIYASLLNPPRLSQDPSDHLTIDGGTRRLRLTPIDCPRTTSS